MSAPPPRPVTPLGLLVAALEEAGAAADEGVGPGVTEPLERALALAAGLEDYVAGCTSPESPALARLAARTRTHDWGAGTGGLQQEMLSGHVEGQLLQMLVRISGARRVLEIGMFTGYSALAMAEALPDGGTVVACELDAGVARFAQESFDASPYGNRIDVRVGPADATLAALAEAGERFDLVFLDADKPGYAGYYDALLDRGLLADGGLLCVDNTLMQGRPYLGDPTDNGAAIADFNRTVADDPRVQQVLVPLRDGVTLVRRV